MSEREQAHQLIDRLPETQLAGLVQFLTSIVDPTAAALHRAPLDDEPLSPEEAGAIELSIASIERTGGVPIEDVLADFGLTVDDLQKAK